MVSVVVRTLNEAKHLPKLVQGLSSQIGVELELILVDSGSSDNTIEIAKKAGFKIVTIKPEEFSFGRSLNKGCEVATGNFLLFASAHVYPLYSNWITSMTDILEKDKNVALCYGRQVGFEGSHFSEERIFASWFPEESDFNQNHPFCNNANCLIRKSLWEEVHYDESLTGLEDLDWAKKMQGQGHKIAYNSLATIVHVHEEAPTQIQRRYEREAVALKKIMPEEKFSFFDFIRLFISNVFVDLVVAIRKGVFFNYLSTIVMFRYNQFYGTWRGFKLKKAATSVKRRYYYPDSLMKKSNAEQKDKHIIKY